MNPLMFGVLLMMVMSRAVLGDELPKDGDFLRDPFQMRDLETPTHLNFCIRLLSSKLNAICSYDLGDPYLTYCCTLVGINCVTDVWMFDLMARENAFWDAGCNWNDFKNHAKDYFEMVIECNMDKLGRSLNDHWSAKRSGLALNDHWSAKRSRRARNDHWSAKRSRRAGDDHWSAKGFRMPGDEEWPSQKYVDAVRKNCRVVNNYESQFEYGARYDCLRQRKRALLGCDHVGEPLNYRCHGWNETLDCYLKEIRSCDLAARRETEEYLKLVARADFRRYCKDAMKVLPKPTTSTTSTTSSTTSVEVTGPDGPDGPRDPSGPEDTSKEGQLIDESKQGKGKAKKSNLTFWLAIVAGVLFVVLVLGALLVLLTGRRNRQRRQKEVRNVDSATRSPDESGLKETPSPKTDLSPVSQGTVPGKPSGTVRSPIEPRSGPSAGNSKPATKPTPKASIGYDPSKNATTTAPLKSGFFA